MIFTKAKDLYERGCNEYLKLFCKKHGFDYDDARGSWVAGDVGGIAMCGDYYIDMATIIADIDNEAPKEEFIKYYDYCLEVAEFELPTPNFNSWLAGCPRTSSETLNRLRCLKKELGDIIKREKEGYENLK
jgi:hypothetical protein